MISLGHVLDLMYSNFKAKVYLQNFNFVFNIKVGKTHTKQWFPSYMDSVKDMRW